MPGNFADAGSWTSVTPPTPWIARSPRVPSVPVPERSARKDDADRPVALVVGQRAQEGVDRHPQAAWQRGCGDAQLTVADRHLAVGRDDVDRIGSHR